MAGKNKGGREVKKTKAAHNVKTTGQTPVAGLADTLNHKPQPKR